MRFLGLGRCSAVLALSEEEAREWGDVVPAELRCYLALRVSTTDALECTTCCQLLADFLGFRYKIDLTDELKARCASSHPALAEHCRNARSAYLIPNFAINPTALHPFDANAGETRWLVVEIKPKGLWKRPRVIGIVVDGVEHYIHPLKLRRCRFSLMQVLKRERQAKCHAASSVPHREYCPNELLIGDQPSIATALGHLARKPENNFRIIRAEGFPNEVDEGTLCALSYALYHSGVLCILATLQLHGARDNSQWEVLDIELLHQWSRARDASSVRWIVVDVEASPMSNLSCECQCGLDGQVKGANLLEDIGVMRRIVPPLNLEESLGRFYVSATAKDVSVLLALSTNVTTAMPRISEDSSAVLSSGQLDVNVRRRRSPHSGVLMEFGFRPTFGCRIGVVDVDAKRQKSITHYYMLDRDILAAWERQGENGVSACH